MNKSTIEQQLLQDALDCLVNVANYLDPNDEKNNDINLQIALTVQQLNQYLLKTTLYGV